jgi:hypothetical protein
LNGPVFSERTVQYRENHVYIHIAVSSGTLKRQRRVSTKTIFLQSAIYPQTGSRRVRQNIAGRAQISCNLGITLLKNELGFVYEHPSPLFRNANCKYIKSVVSKGGRY